MKGFIDQLRAEGHAVESIFASCGSRARRSLRAAIGPGHDPASPLGASPTRRSSTAFVTPLGAASSTLRALCGGR